MLCRCILLQLAIPAFAAIVQIDATADVDVMEKGENSATEETRKVVRLEVDEQAHISAASASDVSAQGRDSAALFPPNSALIVIDVQNCFIDGSLGVAPSDSNAAALPELIGEVIEQCHAKFDQIIFTQDYHPKGHVSYGSSHGMGAKDMGQLAYSVPHMCYKPPSHVIDDGACCPISYIKKQKCLKEEQGECVQEDTELINNDPAGEPTTVSKYTGEMYFYEDGQPLIAGNKACTECDVSEEETEFCKPLNIPLWPDHCMQNDGTDDADFPKVLKQYTQEEMAKSGRAAEVFQKGDSAYVESNSAFQDNARVSRTKLPYSAASPSVLHENITHLYVAGIATDVCVMKTVEDALQPLRNQKSGEPLYNAYDVTLITDLTAAVFGPGSREASTEKMLTRIPAANIQEGTGSHDGPATIKGVTKADLVAICTSKTII